MRTWPNKILNEMTWFLDNDINAFKEESLVFKKESVKSLIKRKLTQNQKREIYVGND